MSPPLTLLAKVAKIKTFEKIILSKDLMPLNNAVNEKRILKIYTDYNTFGKLYNILKFFEILCAIICKSSCRNHLF